MIPYGRQNICQDDIDEIIKTLKSDFLTQGPKVPEFEKTISQYTNSKYGVAVNSATSALHIACLALDVGPKDIIWTSPISFVASANCGLYCGAKVDFVDINSKTFNMCPQKLEEKLEKTKKLGEKLPKVVIPVHLAGQPCDMIAIKKLGDKFGFSIIEDASHAIGGKYQNTPIGNCQYSDITVFSFHPVKIITTAEGGMATTNDKDLCHKMGLFRSHGITKDPKYLKNKSPSPWYYEQSTLGYNYRMTDLQAALGISQMKQIDEFIKIRRTLAQNYFTTLNELPITLPFQEDWGHSSFHLFIIQLKLEDIKSSHKQVFSNLREKGIGVNLHYIPIHTQPYYQSLGFKDGDFPCAEDYYSKSISIPLYPALKKEDQQKIIRTLEEVLI